LVGIFDAGAEWVEGLDSLVFLGERRGGMHDADDARFGGIGRKVETAGWFSFSLFRNRTKWLAMNMRIAGR